MTTSTQLPSHTVSLDHVESARLQIRDKIASTPLLASASLSHLTNCELSLKAENLQLTGSFKVRGALNAMALLDPESGRNGVATFSAGNHGQALAYAAEASGIPCTVYMAANASKTKIDAIRGFGALVSQFQTIHEAFDAMELESAERGATIVMPFSEPDVIAGQGTVGLEILEDGYDVEHIVVPVGGGGLLSGIAVAVKSRRPDVRVVGVCAAGSPAVARALEAGEPVRLESTETIADGLAAPFTTSLNLELIRSHVDDVVSVTDDEMVDALRLLLEHSKTIVEPAGAAAVAALLTGKAAVPVGAATVAILSGGNVDLDRLKQMI